ncbi:uncharacterized protein LOC112164460 isoform X2 [Rosa chinensis]|uniref:uncharacterized protein LOC112164460 isoform X2 n=1 Tax=Rosa chinensis TaxID=74649 RepID=UPI001AD8BC52|nr:uncharacterized protein LOC112164460 isoform X2 [Rosa chinensis]
MPLSPDVQGDQGQILVRLKRPHSSSSEDPSQDQNLTLTPVTAEDLDVQGGQHQEPDPVQVQPAKPSGDPDVPGGEHHDPDPAMPLSPIEVRLKRHHSSLFDSDVAKRPRSSLFSEDPDVPGGQHHDPDPAMPLSPIVVRLKRHNSSLFEDRIHDQNLTPVTEDSDVAKRPRSSLSSEDPDVQGGQHQNPDPVQPVKPSEPVSRTLKEILDECGPNMSKEQELEYAMLFAKWKAMDSRRQRRAENPKYYGEAALNEYIERQKSTWGPCEICFKAGDHISLYCPYRDYVPEGASVGPGVELVCRNCGLPDQHPGAKRAIRKSCFICASDHWGTDCPRAKQHKTVPYNPFPFSDR